MGRGTTITLTVGSQGSSRLDFEVKHLSNGGWAGRDQGAVRRHVEEMERLGVPDRMVGYLRGRLAEAGRDPTDFSSGAADLDSSTTGGAGPRTP